MLKQSSDFQPFEYVKSGYLLIIEDSRERRVAREVWEHSSLECFEILFL